MNEINLDQEPEPKELVMVTQSYGAEQSLGLWGNSSPAEVLAQATEVANVLADVVEQQKLYTMIRDKKHVRVEGWTFLGSVLNTFPVCVWTRPIFDPATGEKLGWEARVEARRNGMVIGTAEAQCLKAEPRWSTAEDYAIRSMSQTRATVKAMRMPLGFIVALKGYATTPAEEMDGVRGIAPPGASEEDLTPALKASIEKIEAKKRAAALSPAVKEMLDLAEANRAREQAKLDERGPVDKAKLAAAGFKTSAEEGPEKCKKCGAAVEQYQAKAGHTYFQCKAARMNPATYDEGGHTYHRPKK